jgi:hypothetical protein
VKASRLAAASDLRGLNSFREYYGKRHRSCILYQGNVKKRIGNTEIWPWQEGIREIFESAR